MLLNFFFEYFGRQIKREELSPCREQAKLEKMRMYSLFYEWLELFRPDNIFHWHPNIQISKSQLVVVIILIFAEALFEAKYDRFSSIEFLILPHDSIRFGLSRPIHNPKQAGY